MNERAPPKAGLSLSKCWQTDTGCLIFQASLTLVGSTHAKKGFLTLDLENTRAPLSFFNEKPLANLNNFGFAALIRKHCTGARVTGVALSDHASEKSFVRLELKTKENSRRIFLTLSHKPQIQIDFIVDDLSLARLQPKKTFTVRKPADREFLAATNLPPESFDLWLSSLESTALTDSDHQTNKNMDLLTSERRQARDKIARRLKTLKKTLKQDITKLPTIQSIQTLREHAVFLSSFLWLVKPHSENLQLTPEQAGGKELIIDLDPKKNPGENLDLAYKRLQKLEKAASLQGERIEKLTHQIEKFEKHLERVRNPNFNLTTTRLSSLMIDLGLASDQKPKIFPNTRKVSSNRALGRTFQLDDKIILTLGRDAKESDQIVKKAKSSDWWIHVAGGSRGSHVIITGLKPKSDLPESILRAAGILALHFSDRSQALEGEVYCTRRQFIRKTKGLAPGLWIVDRSETILIRYTSMELADIFAKELRDGIQRHKGREL